MADTETPTPAAEFSVSEHIEQRAVEADAKKYEQAFAAEGLSEPKPDPAPAEASPEPEPKAEPADDTTRQVHDGVKKLEERINQKTAALAQEREQRRALEQKLAELTAKPAADIPDPATDPIGYLEYDRQQKLAAATAQAEQVQQQAQQRQVQDIVTRAQEHEADFAAANPDYYDATTYLRDSRAKEYQALGLFEADARARVDVEALQTAADMLRRGVDPAKGWYDLARARGFAGKGSAPASAPATEAATAAPAPSVLDTIREGQKAAQSLSSGGRASSGESIDSIVNLKGAAFDNAVAKLRSEELAAEKRARFA